LLIALFGATVALFLWYGVLVFLEPLLLQNVVTPASGMDIQDWLSGSEQSQVVAIVVAWLLAVVWHVISFLSSGRHGDKRILWTTLQVFCPVLSLVLCVLLLPKTEYGALWAYNLAVLNGLIPFWFGTVWCTPGACKYAPLGAKSMRGYLGQ
jgi:hypothetical protein